MSKILIGIAMLMFFLNEILQPMLGEEPYNYGTGIAGILLGVGILTHMREAETDKSKS